METKFSYTKRCPQETANPISRLFFGWIKDVFIYGTKRGLTLSDLYHPLRQDESKMITDRLQKCWNQEVQKWEQKQKEMHHDEYLNKSNDSPSLMKVIFRIFWKKYLYTGLLLSIQYLILMVINPILVSWIISYFKIDENAKRMEKLEVVTYICYLLLSIMVIVCISHHVDLLTQQIGMRIRIACSSLIYRKILRLSKGALTHISSGQVINLLSNDVRRFDEICYYLNYIWITPIQFVIIFVILWHAVGIPSIIGIAILLLLTVPTYTVFSPLTHQYRNITAKLIDKRMQLMNEFINGIQVIKMYAWEKPFEKIVKAIRSTEIQNIQNSTCIRAVYLALVVFSNRVVLFSTLTSFVLMGNQKFLLLDEYPSEKRSHQNEVLKFNKKSNLLKENVEIIKITNKEQNINLNNVEEEEQLPVTIIMERVSANWIPNQLPPTLCNISMKIQGGELCCIVGPVGSGKSSILHLLLKELPLGAGKLTFHCKPFEEYNGYDNNIPLKISYASQEAWLFSGTVRDNILFGQPYDKDRYIAVTKVCALTKDFQQLPYGDMSNVGEGGSSLSGGQKARVNLARAVYKKADIYLFDDPLSAVDSRVAKHLFYRCIKNYLQGKTRILCTHQLQFIKEADKIAVLDKGSIAMYGTYEDLFRSNENFIDMMNVIKSSAEIKIQNENVESFKNTSTKRKSSKTIIRRLSSIKSTTSSMNSYNYENEELAPDNDEIMTTNHSSSKILRQYFRYGGSCCTIVALIFITLVAQVTVNGNDYWVSYWTNIESIRMALANNTRLSKNQYSSYILNDTFLSNVFSLDKYGLITTIDAIYVYTFCIIICIVTVFVRNMFFIKVCANASKNLHNSMFHNILQTTMNFFHYNASGRIVNRFSKDLGVVDEVLPRVMLESIQIFLVIIGILIIVMIMNYWMVIPIAILVTIFYFVRISYLRTANGVKRLEGVAKSPVFSHVNATLSGLSTIRSSGSNVIELLQKQFDHLQDVHTGVWYIILVVPIAFGLFIDFVTCMFIACVCFSFISIETDNTLGGNVGIAISQSLIIIGCLQYGLKQLGETISQLTSVERIVQYTNLPKEASWTSNDPPPINWPENGQLILKNVYMKYDQNEAPVLKNLNVTIEAGWKVGIVGRTGAGKSSIISALFRLFDECLQGEIKIDGRDTRTLGLHELRSRISIIPQEPFLFSETLRYNLDPFKNFDDVLLWNTLREVELNDLKLDQTLMHGGNNLSIGQKQLICLARAILKNNRLLVLDEATANIDNYTDELIQKTIRVKFVNCTVITIAHRINTIIDSDRIIVMDSGKIAEFGCPYELLRDNPNGIFSQMINNTGVFMAQSLRDQAENAYLKKTKRTSLDVIQTCPAEDNVTNDIIAQSSL
ncbi:ATP-binding cassette sub-family C member 4-like isoform X2 [Apis laboriosa]|uniref:ATP-binding cassette sub-family C member 4-like isoform X2 n=1 Tax=Apis laboriosa TaxID=183418 RepID=UPI001CC4E011|nr:ATP-binding cassette sub-family C member 4-like isoform X2 [Apis laboriosa]